ncbi:MFS transporter [Aureibacillus halotolerans]|uniref:Sugar phosphate permease n=1 Tax=Aureibacillus halotolerans TaxID=1508390 RepID=A0A4R6U997_9BACI|nr:MFS transporter [Aureibacillus halotolerans]TDQ41245.1 sugar phosphate permease [Aureibacillus halotolerans]
MVSESKHFKWVILFVATLAQGCATFVTYGMGPLATVYQDSMELTQFQTGLIVSAVNVGPIFSMMFFGDLMDRYGEKWSIGMGAIFLGLSTLLASASQGFYSLLLILLFVGVWYGTAQPGGSSAIIKWFPHNNRGVAMGIRQMGIPLGGAFASMTIPAMFAIYGLNGALVLQAFVAIAGGVVFLLIYRDIGQKKETSNKKTSFMQKIKTIRQNKSLYPVFFVGCSMVSVQLVIVAHLMSFLNNGLNMSLARSGVFLSIALIGGLIGRVAISWISDYFGGNRVKPLQVTICLTSVILVLFAFLPDNPNAVALMCLCFILGFLGMGWFSLFIVLLSEAARPEAIALTVAFGLTLNQLFIVFSPALFGFTVDVLNSYKSPFLFLAAVILIGPIWLHYLDRKAGLMRVAKD